MVIYIRTNKSAWRISAAGIKRVKQPDWDRIQNTFDFMTELIGAKVNRYLDQRRRHQGWFEDEVSRQYIKCRQAAAWKRRADNALPDEQEIVLPVEDRGTWIG